MSEVKNYLHEFEEKGQEYKEEEISFHPISSKQKEIYIYIVKSTHKSIVNKSIREGGSVRGGLFKSRILLNKALVDMM